MDNWDVKIEYREKKKHKILVATIAFDASLLFLFFVKIVAIVQFFIDNSDYQSIDLMITIGLGIAKICAVVINHVSTKGDFQCTKLIIISYLLFLQHAVFLILYIVSNDKFGYIISGIIILFVILDILAERMFVDNRNKIELEKKKLIEQKEAEKLANSDFITPATPTLTTP